MKKKRYIFLLILLLVLGACENTNSDVKTLKIDLSTKDAPIPSIVIRSITKLETTDSSLIGEIERLEVYDNYYYILDESQTKALLIFNKEGNFIKKTKLGKGPGELISPEDFFIDKMRGEIWLFDQKNFRMMKFDLNLNYISSKVYPHLAVRSFVLLGKDTVFTLAKSPVLSEIQDDTETQRYYYLVYTDNFKNAIQKLFPYPSEFTTFTCSAPISKNNGLKFLVPFDYKIYSFNNDMVKPEYILDFGNYGFTESDLQKGLDHVIENIRNGNKISYLDHLHESIDYISFNFWHFDGLYFIIHSKLNDTNYYSKKLIEESLIPKCILYEIIDDEFVCIVEPVELIDFLSKREDLKNYIKTPLINDNPYILKFSIN